METPFASSSLAALRLLASFALTADETAAGRATLLAHAGASGASPCEALAAILSALRGRSSARGVLDGILAATVGREAERYHELSAAELAARWGADRESLEGRPLVALVWQVARRHEPALRDLESEIARSCAPERLLSPEQRLLDPLRSRTANREELHP